MNSSRLLDKAVDQFASLPGVGRKTALKFVLHLLKKDVQEVDDFLKSIGDLKKNIKECRRCHNISDGEICEICSDPKRDNTTLCVVENIKDILSIEATSQYNGLYHVLGGIISPMDGIGPADLHITSLSLHNTGPQRLLLSSSLLKLKLKKKKKSIQVMGFSHLLSLFSLPVLDTRLDPPSDEKKRQQIIAKAGPARWKTREFYIYGFIFAICVPLMCKGAIDASRCKH